VAARVQTLNVVAIGLYRLRRQFAYGAQVTALRNA
jgi:hypothetical protein